MTDFEDLTTESSVKTYESAIGVFQALLGEIRELSRKKPDATLSKNKVTLLNNVLKDLLSFLSEEAEGKYLSELVDKELPQASDALLMMVQFEASLSAFKKRYYKYIEYSNHGGGKSYWITEELIAYWEESDDEPES